MVHELPEAMGIQITALNFGASEIDEELVLTDLPVGSVVNMFDTNEAPAAVMDGHIRMRLNAYEGKSLLHRG